MGPRKRVGALERYLHRDPCPTTSHEAAKSARQASRVQGNTTSSWQTPEWVCARFAVPHEAHGARRHLVTTCRLCFVIAPERVYVYVEAMGPQRMVGHNFLGNGGWSVTTGFLLYDNCWLLIVLTIGKFYGGALHCVNFVQKLSLPSGDKRGTATAWLRAHGIRQHISASYFTHDKSSHNVGPHNPSVPKFQE